MERNETVHVFLVGKDKGYFGNLTFRIKDQYSKKNLKFSEFIDMDEMDPQQLYKQIVKARVSLLFIDFTKQYEKCVSLVKLLRRDNITKMISTTALFDHNTEKWDIQRVIDAGVRLVHIKSAVEISNVVYSAYLLYAQRDAWSKPLAAPKFDREFIVKVDMKMAYATRDYYRVETNLPIPINDPLNLKDHVLKDKLKSHHFDVAEVYDQDLYYNKRWGLKLKYKFVNGYDPTIPDTNLDEVAPGTDEESGELTHREILSRVNDVRVNVDKWIEHKADGVVPKSTKVLILDRRLDIFGIEDDEDENVEDDPTEEGQNDEEEKKEEEEKPPHPVKDLEKLPYTFTVQTRLSDDLLEVKRALPHLIAFSYDPPPADPPLVNGKPVPIEPLHYFGGETMLYMINNFKSIQGYEPFVVVFSAKHRSETLREKLSYAKIISYPEPVNIDIICSFAEKFQKAQEAKETKAIQDKLKILQQKDPKNWRSKKPKDLMEQRVYFKGSDPNTLVSTEKIIKVIQMTEYRMYFICPDDIPMYTVLRAEFPTSMYMTVVPIEPNNQHAGEKDCYSAVINGVGELAVQEIRQFINTLSTQDVAEKEQAEIAQFKEKNEAAQKQRDEAKAAAEAAKAAKEAAIAEAKAAQEEEKEAAIAEAKAASDDDQTGS